jgi:hypothetical protein
MAASIGNLYASLTLNSAEFISGLKRAERQTNQTSSALSSNFGKMRVAAAGAMAGIIATFSIDFTAELIKRALDFADTIADLSDRTGASTRSIQEFRYAAQLSGSDIETADVALEKFTKNLGLAQSNSQAQVKMFRELGVTSGDFDVALRQTIDGISQLPTLQQRNAAAMEIFGKKAGTLTALLSQGSKGFDELARRAHELGVVLGDDVVRNAGQANDQLDTMKMILTAQLASVIVQNAGAIVSLAQGISSLVGALAQFWNSNPRSALAIIGALGGGVVGGPIGAAIGGVGGFMAGDWVDKNRRQKNPALYRAMDEQKAAEAALAAARSGRKAISESPSASNAWGTGLWNVYRARPNGPNPKEVAAAQARLNRANATLEAERKKNTGIPATTGLGTDLGTTDLPGISSKPFKPSGSSAPQGPTPEQIAKMMADNLFNFNRDLADARNELLDAQSALLSSNPAQQAADQKSQLLADLADRNAIIDRDMQVDPTRPNEPPALSAAQGEQLKLLYSQIATARSQLIDQEEAERILEEQLRIRTSELQNEQDLLAGSSALARTASERRSIELRILDLAHQREKAELDAVVASSTATDAEKKIAEARLAILDRLKGNQEREIKQQTMGPLENYLDSIPQSAAEIDEAFQNIAVGGLQEFREGILDAILESKNLGDVFGNVAKSIIRGLLDIALQQAIIKPIGAALFGGGEEGGSGGGWLSSIFGGAKKLLTKAVTPTQGHANGGLFHGGYTKINERGDEAINIPGGVIMPNRAFKQLVRGSGGGGTVINVDARGSSDPAAVRLQVAQGIAAAMPINNQNATNATLGKLQRPRLGR